MVAKSLNKINIKQYDVVIDEHYSDLLDMTCGVPQCSVLGPIMFIIYINDISNVSAVVKCALFADDTNIFCSERNLTDLQLKLNRGLKRIIYYFVTLYTDLNICIHTINVTSHPNVLLLF